MSPRELAIYVGPAIALTLLGMIGVGWYANRRVESAEDYAVAGRRLGLGLAVPTLVATWFGAGALFAVADEVAATGLRAAALDPLGAGACLLLAGLFFAAPLWRMKLMTVADFFDRRFGPRAELFAALVTVPAFIGWIAAQFAALAGILDLFFGLPTDAGLALVALVGLLYTWLGGMWAVTLTDALQMALAVVGLGAMAWAVASGLGGGDPALAFGRLGDVLPPAHLVVIPLGDAAALLGWVGLFAAGALGNLPGQDLLQRIFAARSAQVARSACLLAGGAYLLLGAVPVFLGLSAPVLLPDGGAGGSTLASLSHLLLHPALAVTFVVTTVCLVLSTIDSAILAPATTLAQNVAPRVLGPAADGLARHRAAVLVVAAMALVTAYAGESAYALLESSYEIGMVSLLTPLALGLYWRRGGERAALASMGVGTGAWTLHFVAGWQQFANGALGALLPVGLTCLGLAVAAYVAVAGCDACVSRSDSQQPPRAPPGAD